MGREKGCIGALGGFTPIKPVLPGICPSFSLPLTPYLCLLSPFSLLLWLGLPPLVPLDRLGVGVSLVAWYTLVLTEFEALIKYILLTLVRRFVLVTVVKI